MVITVVRSLGERNCLVAKPSYTFTLLSAKAVSKLLLIMVPRLIRVEGNYDDAVHEADVNAGWNGYTLISDTSYEGLHRYS